MKIISILIMCFGFSVHLLHAKDYGIRGHVFSIQEQDLLEYLKQLNSMSEEEMEQTGKVIQKRYSDLNLIFS